MAKVNLDTTIKDFDGAEVKEPHEGGERPITVRRALLLALGPDYRDHPADGEEKIKRYELAMKIAKGGSIDMEAEDIVRCKKVSALRWPPEIYGFLCAALAGKLPTPEGE